LKKEKRKGEGRKKKGDKKPVDESDEKRGYGPTVVVIRQKEQYLSMLGIETGRWQSRLHGQAKLC
jgi:hypothetical protein